MRLYLLLFRWATLIIFIRGLEKGASAIALLVAVYIYKRGIKYL
jgi:hypothetical protein